MNKEGINIMLSRRRIVLESVLFAVVIYGGYYLFMIWHGYRFPEAYIEESDTNSNVGEVIEIPLQSSSSHIAHVEWNSDWSNIKFIVGFFVLCFLYTGTRMLLIKWMNRT
ncbi:hypothetical protein [Paenibacillus sp. JCM 10914]